jgi:hypothetical protein
MEDCPDSAANCVGPDDSIGLHLVYDFQGRDHRGFRLITKRPFLGRQCHFSSSFHQCPLNETAEPSKFPLFFGGFWAWAVL